MANFVPAYGLGARLGNQVGNVLGDFGQAIGSGIQYQTANILEDLANKKALDMRVSQLRPLFPNLSEQQLGGLLGLPERLQHAAIAGGYGVEQIPQQITGSQAVQQLPFSPEQAASLAAMPEEQRNQILQRLSQGPTAQLVQQRAAQKKGPIGLQEAIQKGGGISGTAGMLSKEAGIAKRHAENLAFKKEQEQEKISKGTREFSQEYQRRAHAAQENKRDYNLLIDAAKRGKLRSGNTAVILDKLGLSGIERDFDTQLADKVIARLGQNVSGAFGTGSRLTNYLEQTFQRSLPSLWNTPEGIIAVSSINMLTDELNEYTNKIRNDILKETSGRVPYDIDDEILRRSQPYRQKLEDMGLEIARHFAEGTKIQPPSEGDFFPINGAKWKLNNGDVLEVLHNKVNRVKKGK